MGAGNGRVCVVDYTVMRIYQRGGDNWGFSYGLGGVLVLGFVALSVLATVGQYIWPVLVVGLAWMVVAATLQWRQRYLASEEEARIHDTEHVGGVVDDTCEFCELDLLALKDRERQERISEQRRDEATRLRAKYRS